MLQGQKNCFVYVKKKHMISSHLPKIYFDLAVLTNFHLLFWRVSHSPAILYNTQK